MTDFYHSTFHKGQDGTYASNGLGTYDSSEKGTTLSGALGSIEKAGGATTFKSGLGSVTYGRDGLRLGASQPKTKKTKEAGGRESSMSQGW